MCDKSISDELLLLCVTDWKEAHFTFWLGRSLEFSGLRNATLFQLWCYVGYTMVVHGFDKGEQILLWHEKKTLKFKGQSLFYYCHFAHMVEEKLNASKTFNYQLPFWEWKIHLKNFYENVFCQENCYFMQY